MGKVDLNALAQGFSGRLGNAVLKRKGNRIYIVQKPIRRKPVTPAEQVLRQRFKEATTYAKAVLQDPAARAYYANQALKGAFLTPYSVAIGDYLKAPVIQPLKLDNYSGHVDDVIGIPAADNGGVTAVTVTITRADGVVLESGAALLPVGEVIWQYRATVANGMLAGTTIEVVAKDRAGNETVRRTVL